MKANFCCIFFCLGYFSLLTAQVYFGQNNYIEYRKGNIPIVISAPHGGKLTPSLIPDRTCNNATLVTDSNTDELIAEIDSAFMRKTGCRPHIVICHLKRSKIDCNRNLADGTCGNADATIAWNEFYRFIDNAIDSAGKDGKNPLYIDLHGHGHPKQRLEVGYLLSAAELRLPDETLNNPPYIGYSAIQNLVSTNVKNDQHAALLRGAFSVGTLFHQAGYPAVPSKQDPYPLVGEDYFDGGYNTAQHSCYNPDRKNNGFQIECNMQGVRDSKINRVKFSDSLVVVLSRYLSYYQNTSLSACSVVGTQIIEVGQFHLTKTSIAKGESLDLPGDGLVGKSYVVFNALAQLSLSGIIQSNQQIDCNNLAPGAYFLQIIGASTVLKFVVY